MIFIIVIFSIAFLSYKAYVKLKQKNIAENTSNRIPKNLKFYNTSHESFTYDSLDNKSNYLIIFFNTECDLCQNEIKDIVKNYNSFSNMQILCISIEEPEKIREFENIYNPGRLKSIRFLCDYDRSFFTLFGTYITPSTFIYNSSQTLVKKYSGEVSYEILIKQSGDVH